MGGSSDTLNSTGYVLRVTVEVIQFWTEIRYNQCKYLACKGIRHSEWTITWPRASVGPNERYDDAISLLRR